MGQNSSVHRLGNHGNPNGLQRSGSSEQAASRPAVAAGPQVFNKDSSSPHQLYPADHPSRSSLRMTSPQVFWRRVPSVLDRASQTPKEIGKALGARTKAILRQKNALQNLSGYEGPLNAWRFQEANPYAQTFPVSPTSEDAQTCPFFSPGCHCMMTGVPSYPIYYSTNKRSHTSLEYVKNMAYIPGVLPSVPPRPGPSAHAKPQGKKLVTETHESGFHGASSPPSWRRSATDTSSIPQLIEASTAPAGSRHGKGAAQPPQKQKRAFEAKESPEPAEDDQPKSKRKKANQGVQDHEKALIARYMQEEIDNRNLTESKWQNVTEKLKSHGIDRSGHSVKAWWSRHGRQEFGIDERKNPHGRKLVTSKQDPEERRKARERKRREAVEGKCSNDHKKTKTARSLQKPDGSDEEDKVEDDDELAEAPT